MVDYYLKQVNHEELITLFHFFFGSAQRSAEYKIIFTKKTDEGGEQSMDVCYSKQYNITEIDDSKLSIETRLELSSTIKKNLLSKPKRRIGRFICFSNRQLKGTFKYRDGFQILSMPEDAPNIDTTDNFFMSNYPFIVEVEYNETEDMRVNRIRRTRKLHSVLRILNVLTRYSFNISQKSTDLVWGYPSEGENKHKAEIFQTGYLYEKFQGVSNEYTDSSLHQVIDLVEPNLYYQWTFQDSGKIKLPTTLEEMIDKIYKLSEIKKEKFNIACLYFHKGVNVWNESPSISFICFVIATEALIDSKKNVCDKCGQDIYSVKKKFQNFLDTYLPPNSLSDSFKKKIYNTRSNLAHGTTAFKQDIDGGNFMGVREGHESDLQISTYFVMRVLLYNWLDAQEVED